MNSRGKRYLGRITLAVLAAGLGVLLLAALRSTGSAPAHSAAPAQSFEQGGIRVQMQVDTGERARLEAGAPLGIRFTVAEVSGRREGQRLAGLFPLAWLVRREPGEAAPTGDECKRLIRSLLSGRLGRSAAVNLNEYYLITLDDNNSISIIDPQIASARTKTLGMISLPSKGVDIALAPDRDAVFVSLARGGLVARASIHEMRGRYIEVGGQPERLAVQPDGRLLWVGDHERDSVVAIDIDTLSASQPIPAVPGPHQLAFASDGNRVFVAGPRSSVLVVIETRDTGGSGGEPTRVAEIELGAPAIAMGASGTSRELYLGLGNGQVLAVDQQTLIPSPPIELGADIGRLAHLAVSPDGRWVFAVAGDTDQLVIIDTATHEITHRVTTLEQPERIELTETFAYVRHAGSGRYLLLDLATLAQRGKPQLADVVMGHAPPTSGYEGGVAPLFAELPEGGGALLLSPADRSVYHYAEGMAAPMGSYPLYPWPARGMVLADRSLTEVEKGVYRTTVTAPSRPGLYTVPFLTPGSPQLHDCSFVVDVPGMPGRAPDVALSLDSVVVSGTDAPETRPGTRTVVEVRLSDPATGAPAAEIDDVLVLAMQGPRWQWRGPARALPEGAYEVEIPFPQSGHYMIMVRARSHGVEFGQLPGTLVTVGAGVVPGPPAAPEAP